MFGFESWKTLNLCYSVNKLDQLDDEMRTIMVMTMTMTTTTMTMMMVMMTKRMMMMMMGRCKGCICRHGRG